MPTFKEIADDMAREKSDEELRRHNLHVELANRAKLIADDFNKYAASDDLPIKAHLKDAHLYLQDQNGEKFAVYPVDDGLFDTRKQSVSQYTSGVDIQNIDKAGIDAEAMQRLVIAWCKAPRSIPR